MKKLIGAFAAVSLVAAVGGVAHAGNGNGNQGCHLRATDTTYKNPGKMFQAIRENSADLGHEPNQNPVEWLNNFPDSELANVGEFIHRNCVTDNPPTAP